ncbi:MAG: MATE family efflux transporter [Clostridiales bacterium]|nr:MATE family efflux transporter [Clostridiales bacterium]
MEQTAKQPKRKKEIDLTSGNLFVKILYVSFPLMLSGVLQLLYNTADLVVCGKFGSEHAVGAISATLALINLIINLFLGLSVGASVLVSRHYGRRDIEACERITHTAMLLSPILGLVVGALGIAISRSCLKLMGISPLLFDLSAGYLMIYFAGLPFSMVYNFGSALMRATGDTRRPFFILMCAGVVNVLLNLLFVIVFKLDVNGVATATVISQGISACAVVIFLKRNNSYIHLSFKRLRICRDELVGIIKIGVPAGAQGVIFSLSNVLLQSSINSLGNAFGEYINDGSGAAQSLEAYVYTCMNAVSQTCVAFVSANYGIGNFDNIKKSIGYSCIIVSAYGLIVGGLMALCGKPLLGMYTSDAQAIKEGYGRLIVVCLPYLLCGLMETVASSIRGMGKSLLPAIVTCVGVCGIRIVWIYAAFPAARFHSLQGLLISYPLSWTVTIIIHLICLFSQWNNFKSCTLTPVAEAAAITAESAADDESDTRATDGVDVFPTADTPPADTPSSTESVNATIAE